MDAGDLIRMLDLQPHPEGGWYRETWRADSRGGNRPASTAIHFLLRAGERSHWHRVDGDEIWLHHAGAPLLLSTADTTSTIVDRTLGGDVTSGQHLQLVVPAGHWQAAESLGEWTLVSCVVAPGFSFDGFELAPAGWQPSAT